jgi:hypothetical protein
MNICIKEKRNYGKKKRENKKKKEISFPSSAGPIPAHAPLSLASALSPSALGPPWPTFSRARGAARGGGGGRGETASTGELAMGTGMALTPIGTARAG